MPFPQHADVRIVSGTRAHLGEGPHWDADTGELLHVDITKGVVHGWDPEDARSWQLPLGGEVSAAIPRASGGLLLAMGHDLVLRDPGGEHHVVASVEADLDHTRFNDCRCDTGGRLWAGTMSRDRLPGTAALYRLNAGQEIERVVSGTTISNGLGWSPGGERMYFIDSTTQAIDVFDYDVSTGVPSERRVLARVDRADGLPDGLTVDVEGGIWVCLLAEGRCADTGPTAISRSTSHCRSRIPPVRRSATMTSARSTSRPHATV